MSTGLADPGARALELATCARDAIDALERAQRGEGGDPRDAVRAFMRHVHDLGRLATLHPELRDAVVAALEPTAGRLAAADHRVHAFASELDRRLFRTFEGDEILGCCADRSALEFLRDLYRDTAYAPYLERMDLSDVDATLAERSETEGCHPSSVVPDGIPASHTWWHLVTR